MVWVSFGWFFSFLRKKLKENAGQEPPERRRKTFREYSIVVALNKDLYVQFDAHMIPGVQKT